MLAHDINLLSIGETEFEHLFDFELSHVPTSLCTEMGEPRYSKAKSLFKIIIPPEKREKILNKLRRVL